MEKAVWIQDAARDRWLGFPEPVAVLAAQRLEAVRPLLAEAAARVEAEGLWAVGFLAYEAAPAFDPALAARPAPVDGIPLLWLAMCAEPRRTAAPFASDGAAPGGLPGCPKEGDPGFRAGPWTPSLDDAGYRRAVASIRQAIARGDTYQVNLTYRLTAPFAGDPRGFFRHLLAAQGGRHGAYLDTGRFVVCSASPELFFELDGRRLTARPMKGTARRGLWAADDRERAGRLHGSAKERAENLMIVDMLRNDLGRVALPGTVAVPELLAVERYPTVLQMTSTVTAESDAPVEEIVAALFPCASVTGAPKPSTTAIIAGLEDTPRGVYTGAVGYLAPGRRARFNVAIRTAVVDRERGEAVYGVGGGVLWDSDAAAERRECELKARVVTAPPRTGLRPAEFELLETLRFDPQTGWALLPEHLERLGGSAEYFGFACDPVGVERRLAELAAELRGAASSSAQAPAGSEFRVRLRLARDGMVALDAEPLSAAPAGPLRLGVAPAPVDPDDPFLYHKTTRREVYERALAARPGCDDVMLWNPAGEATESTVANLVVRADGGWATPPLAAGLLPGTARARLLAEGLLCERRLPLAGLAEAEIWLVNSVRGWRRAELTPEARSWLASRELAGAGA
jgi:para-aminobenzoate synthetase/4-amino-4-deoxychorismate lyase